VAHARSFRSRRTSGSSRRVSWSLGPHGETGTLSAPSSALFTVSSQALIDDLTVIRTRGRLGVGLISAAAEGDGFRWAFGMANVSENAAGIGITAVPTPITDIAWDGWFVFETGTVFTEDSSPAAASPSSTQIIEIDSKAMRKTHNTDVIVAVFEVVEIGTATMQAFLSTRLLDKLP